ncbi:ABC transporter ATP-binding protein [Bacillus licheniformis]|jgi:ATP-binding cassette subfamily B multidrug efflux pump|uniref:ABC transporter n=6 Tax=Bacteria TaxID=2 RepID=Q65IR0_BACLD|nr:MULTISPECIES: ABC transporter ATP-binding protein [Bacillus]MBJ7887213.1 ABC transporter ATP-binding protein [Bacillaceae bacterium HSR45]MBY8346771.1 ABC transporter ATP-binding protein [Bacillus sp. PCH94]MDP4079439.1 ABC transporter ATP-binding protein [Bacillota bacterium]AAU23692.1 ABC transporter [Bacillus licheniformis DSM 13 = ATCC 14580]AAU41054.1 antimicrobial peptide ABC transporter ATP-binding protein and permease YfiC [Bacillus licheniformis DSM 13 = ATCC 14580]
MSQQPKHHGSIPKGMHKTKPKEFKKTLLRLARYLKPRTFQLVLVVFAAILATLFNVISPKLLGDATSSLFASFKEGTGVQFGFLGRITLILAGLYLLSALFTFLQHYLMAGVAQKTIYEMRQEVNEKLTRLPLKYYDKHSHGDTLSRAVNDIDNINTSLQQALTQMITSVITIVGIIVMMLLISPVLTLVVFITVPLSMLAVRFIASFSQKHFAAQQKELGDINGHVEEMFTGHQEVKAFGHEEKAIQQFDEVNERLYQSGWKAQFISGLMMPMMTFIGNLGYVFVSITGGIFVLNGTLLIGGVQAFIQYTQQFSQPLVQAAGIANTIQSAIASAERVFSLLDEEEETGETPASIDTGKLKGDVSFEHVAFGYDKNVPVIRDLSLHAKEGQTIAIVGPTGAGKTTIINLLMRFYELNKGSIKVGGTDISELSREQARSMFAMVLQDTWLFNGTIRENIAYGREGATEEDIIRAAKGAYADDFIRTLPDGYDTVLGEDAQNISQGQRQLLTIARAILADPKILILDEATSSVDTRTEMNIQKAMNKLMANRTSFVIAHRLSTIKDADMILVMKNGDIIEKGSHEELLRKNGFYADLYNSQFSREEAVS